MEKPGEFEIIARYFSRRVDDPSVRVGIGDDAAIVAPQGEIAIAVDTLVAGTHFPPGLDADAIGHRALAVNLSDLAAVGARPRWATLALCLDRVDTAWLESFARGFFRLADAEGVSLIGGDTTRGALTVTVGIFGDAASSPLLRAGGRDGDRVLVSGTLGDSAAALEHFPTEPSRRPPAAAELIRRFSYPEPRVALGRALAGIAHAAIDVSDGLLADLNHICERSGCGAEIDLDAIPLSPALKALYPAERARSFALSGGDDYELCFTAAPRDVARVSDIAAGLGIAVTEIGKLTSVAGIRGRRGGESRSLAPTGYVHF
jgi:thiamine-monophosphate kinase